MVILRIKEKLQRYPHVTYTTSERHLAIPAQSPTGFRVWIQERPDGYTVGFDGWHAEFTDGDEAFNCLRLVFPLPVASAFSGAARRTTSGRCSTRGMGSG
jgi:hypothetical protein